MSVLYKALQKAAKDNEQRQAPSVPFDAERLAGSGVIRQSGGRRGWRVAGLILSLFFLVAMGAAFYLTSSDPGPPPKMQVAELHRPAAAGAPQVTPPPPAAPASTPQTTAVAAASTTAPTAPPAASAPPTAPVPAASPAAPAPVAQTAAAVQAAAPAAAAASEPAATDPEPTSKQAAEETAPAKPRVVARAPARPQPMPDIDPRSPASMLNPPINIHRSQFDLEGVGDAVQVRQVSQAAQDEVGSAYNALIRGDYDTALGFYDKALKQEPKSVLALLGRGASLQKLGRKEEARQSYQRALQVSPGNREALTNLTSLEGERAPGEALARLLDLDKEYPNFSPVKAQIALIYARLENYEGALEYFQRALVVTPDTPLYLYNMALVLDRLGKTEQAVAMYERVLNGMSGGRPVPEISAADIQRRVAFLRGG